MIRGAGRDLEAVRLLAVHRFLTRPQLEELLFAATALTPRSRQVLAWRVLARLQRDGYVRATQRQTGGITGGSVLPAYFLTTAGLRVAGNVLADLPKYRPARRAAFLAPHSVATAEIELVLRRTARMHEDEELVLWEPDWQIGMRFGDKWVVPDGRLVYRIGKWNYHMFVEADLGTEGTRFFTRKIGRYLELRDSGEWKEFLGTWPRVLTVTLTDARAASLHRASESFLDRRYYRTRLACSFLSIDALGRDGIRALCHVTHENERRPLIDLEALAARIAQERLTAASTDPRTVDNGRSGASGRRDDQTPNATRQVDGLA